MKKTNLIIIGIIIISVVLIFLLKSKETKTTLEVQNDHFQIEDTSQITKIFIAKKTGETHSLDRVGSSWQLDNNFFVNRSNIQLLMEVLVKMRIKSPVGVQNRDGVIKSLSTNHFKIEIYGSEGLMRTYFMGAATQDGLGNYIYEEGMGTETPYIVAIPGWNGNFGPRFEIDVNDWRRSQVFTVSPANIASVTVNYYDKPQFSYTLSVNENKQIELSSPGKENIPTEMVNQAKARQVMFNVNKVHFTDFIPDSLTSLRDSILNHFPKVGSVGMTALNGNQVEINIVKMPVSDADTLTYSDIQCYAFTKGSKPQTMALMQWQALEKILSRFDLFQKAN